MAAVTIYWYGPERPASRRCLMRCAALFAGEPLAGAEERWPVKESLFFRFHPKPIVPSPTAGITGLALFPASRSALICRFTSQAAWRRCPAVFSIRRGTGICRLSDFRIFTGSGRQRRVLSNFPAKGSAEISAGFPLPGRWPAASVCAVSLRLYAMRLRKRDFIGSAGAGKISMGHRKKQQGALPAVFFYAFLSAAVS